MRTTMSLDDRLVKELMRVTGAKTRTAAIHLAISEFVRRKKLEGLKALTGKIRIADHWQELEEIELKEQAKQERRWRGHR
ncbi:MAG: type II toxin-antitoxin system VapB family antitoxin [Candidatus Rokubacteria bacterium]|nr:type II toxin-antitoxin system VapB family antitoxin [Candidatus Rokubacteria bacterium]